MIGQELELFFPINSHETFSHLTFKVDMLCYVAYILSPLSFHEFELDLKKKHETNITQLSIKFQRNSTTKPIFLLRFYSVTYFTCGYFSIFFFLFFLSTRTFNQSLFSFFSIFKEKEDKKKTKTKTHLTVTTKKN